MNPLLILFLIIGAGQLGVSDRYSQCDAGGNHCTTYYKQPDGTYSAIPEKSQPAPLKCGKGEQCNTLEKAEEWPLAYNNQIQPPDKPCDKFQYSAMTAADKPGFAYKALCVDIPHVVSEREWQELKEWREFIDHLRKEQCPSLSWAGGKCLPFCDEAEAFSSCAHRGPKEGKQ